MASSDTYSLPFREVKRIIQKVDGWLTESEAKYLYSLASRGPGQGAIVEIGSWKGKSTIVLASGSSARGREKVYAVDHHKGSAEHENMGYKDIDTEREFRENITTAAVENHVIPLVMTSIDAVRNWQGPIRLLWIDGDHDYEAVKSDFLLWEPHVVPGGVIAFHDTYSWEGPRKVVEEYLLRSDHFSILGFVDSITAVRKQRPSYANKGKREFFLFIRHLYILARQHILPGEMRKWTKAMLRAMSVAK
jgi:MMP 1-O-methyltransferase